MHTFIYSTFHDIGKDLIEMLGKVGFTFSTRDELDFKCFESLKKFGYEINSFNAGTAVIDSNLHSSKALPLNDSHELYREISRSRENLSYVRIFSGIGKNGFNGVMGFTNFRTQQPQNVDLSAIPEKNQPGSRYQQIIAIGETRYPKWKDLT